jgi:hypothetical protein
VAKISKKEKKNKRQNSREFFKLLHKSKERPISFEVLTDPQTGISFMETKMNAPQFNQIIGQATQMAFNEGVAKSKMSAIEVAQILSFHSANVLKILVEASQQAKIKATAEIILPFPRQIKPPSTEQGKSE